MAAQPRPLTPESLAQDVEQIGVFLRTFESIHAGRSVEELLGFLDSLQLSPISMEMFCNALNGAMTQPQGQPARR